MTDKSSVLTANATHGNSGGLFEHLGWRHLAYYVGVPLLFALYAGINNWEMQHIAGFRASILFYVAHSLLPWWLTCTSTALLMKILARWKPPWLLLLLMGHTMGSLLVLPYSNWLAGLYEARWPELEIIGSSAPLFSNEIWMYLRAGVIWIGVNFVFDRFVGLPLYRYTIPRGYENGGNGAAARNSQDSWGGRPPGFVERLPATLEASEVLAIKAEQHYIRVYSPNKEYMILYRFSDAVRELDESLGQQVHRSYWVNTDAIESMQAKAKDFQIRISNGADIPVSTPYQGMIRELARSARIPLRG
jgi:hypothetical protein